MQKMLVIIFHLCAVFVFLEGSKGGKMQNSDKVRLKRSLYGNGFYLFGNDSSEYITIPNLFPSLESNVDHINDSVDDTTLPYPEGINSQQNATDYFTDPSTQYDLFSVSTTNSPLRLLSSEKSKKRDRSSDGYTNRGNYLEPPKIDLLIRDIDERLMTAEATSFLNNLRNDFQRMAVLTNLYSCPFVKLCKFSLSLNYENYAFKYRPLCCDKCSCKKEECVASGTCCPDVDWFVVKPRVLSRGVEEKCVPTGIRPRKNTGAHVKVLTGCPLYTDQKLVQPCVKDYTKPSTDVQFEDIVAVTDLSSKEIYRNKHCAMCNFVNVSNLVYWSPEIICISEPRNTTSAYETLTAVLNGELKCDIEFLKPTELDMPFVSCSNAISTCNVTGLWRKYDQVTETACAMYGSYVYKDYSTVFRNIFCSICNGHHLSLDDICKFRMRQDYYTNTFSRMLLLKESPKKTEDDDKRNAACGIDRIFDKLKKKCRVARCSTGRQLEDEKCSVFNDSIRNLTINIKIRLLAQDRILLTDAYNMVPEITTTLTKLVEDKLNVTDKYTCGLQVILVSNVKPDHMADFKISYFKSTDQNVNSSNLKTGIDEAELRHYDIRLQITTVLRLEQITKFMSKMKGSKVSIKRRLFENSREAESARPVSPSPTTTFFRSTGSLSQEPDQSSYSFFTFHIQLAHGINSENFDLIANTGYFLLTDDVYEGQKEVDIHAVYSYLSFLQDKQGIIQFPFLCWNDEFVLCKSSEERKDLSSFQDCPLFIIPWSEIYWTETADGLEFNDSSVRLDISEFVIERADDFSIRLLICVETYEKKFSPRQYPETNPVGHIIIAKFFISILSVSASIVCLLISLLTFCLLKQLQTIPGKNNMALIVSLLFAQSMYILGSFGGFATNGMLCKTIGLLTHFFWLLSIFWMNVCTFHMCRVLLRTRNVSYIPDTRKYLIYHTYCIVLASLFVSINVIVSMVRSENSEMGYGKVICYISTQSMIDVTFGVPAALVVASNIIMFLAIVFKLKNIKTIQKNVKNERNYFLVFVKLSTVTGLTWIFGFVYMWSEIEVFSFLFIILNASQGVFIMFAFVINKRTTDLYKNRSNRHKAFMSNARRATLTASTTA